MAHQEPTFDLHQLTHEVVSATQEVVTVPFRLTLPNTPRGTYDPSGYVYEAVPSNRVQGATVNL